MKEKHRRLSLFILTTVIILTCVFVSLYFAGINHEDEHLKHILITIFIVWFVQAVLADPIKLILLAIDEATWQRGFPMYRKNPQEEDDKDYNRLELLKRRLISLKFQIKITERHRNESLNEQYKLITQDLFNYGRFMFILFLMLILSRDELLFHNTKMITSLLMKNHTGHVGVEAVYDLNQLYDFIELTLVNAFDHDSYITGPHTWVHQFGTKMVGVVRIRQLRLADQKLGWGDPKYSNTNYMPGWELPHRRLHYADRYWRTYEPWISIEDRLEFIDQLLLNYNHFGKFQDYPELKGYISLLARSRENSMKILDFLEDNVWLNYNTSAVFLDLTLYNVDANIFGVVNIRLERTPFGSIISHVEVDSVSLIEKLEKKSYLELFMMALYIIMVLLLIETYVMHVWNYPSKMSSVWYIMDLIIIILNVCVIVLFIARSYLTITMLTRLEGANKLEFLDFRRPTRLHNITATVCGLLICLTTMRVWKLMQFSTVFQTFTKTLYAAWGALAATSIVIFIILMAFGIAFTTINGNNSVHFLHLFKTIISCLLFAFGFRTEIKPEEVFFGGKYLGMAMYAAMGFIVSIFLLNLFVSIVNDYFNKERITLTDYERRQKINYFEFLMVEYYEIVNWITKWFARGYKSHNRTVAENIQRRMDEYDKQQELEERRQHQALVSAENKTRPPPKTEEILQAEYRERIEYTLAISRIMNTQLQILELMLFPEEEKENKKKKKPKNKPSKDQNNPDDNTKSTFDDESKGFRVIYVDEEKKENIKE